MLLSLLFPFAVPAVLVAQIAVGSPNPATVSVTIGAAPANALKIPAALFGSFLEPIGDSINHGLSAEILTNPSLESGLWDDAHEEEMFRTQPELIQSSNKFALPLPWLPLDPREGRRFTVHYGNAANSWQSLEMMGVPGYDVGIMQEVYLPVQRTLDYKVSFYAKHLEGSPRITVLLRSHDGGKILAQATVVAAESTWKKYAAELTLPPGAVQPMQQVDFGVKVEADERVDVDEFSLMPNDATDGFDPDVVAMAKAMNLAELRFGGNFTSTYDWRDGIGPIDKRVSMENLAWGIPEYNTFGTDEFLAFCKLIHTVPQFDLNMGSGTPQLASEWVRYIRQHYHGKVIYEMGNELYNTPQTGWVPVDQIAARTLAFSKAVRAVDPDAEIIATGERPNSFEKWNAEQLRNPAGTYNYLSTHFIRGTERVALQAASPDFKASSAYALPYEVGRNLQQMEAQKDAVPGYRGKVHFAMTEWLFSGRGQGGKEGPGFSNEGGALMIAGVFNTLIRTSPIVELTDMTGVLEFAGIWKQREQTFATPSYYTFRLYSSVKDNTILPVKTDSGTYDVHGGIQGYEEMTGVPYIDVVAALSPDGKVLTLFSINRDLKKDIPVQLEMGWFHPGPKVDVEQIKAASRDQANSDVNPRHVIPVSSTFTVEGQGPASYTLPHESVTMMRFYAR
jgi:alpha-N-arabinofuranosidase